MTDQDQPGVDTGTDVRALVARLRTLPGWWRFKQVADDAADTIERLLAERDAQVRESFMAGRRWCSNEPWHEYDEAALTAWLATRERPSTQEAGK